MPPRPTWSSLLGSRKTKKMKVRIEHRRRLLSSRRTAADLHRRLALVLLRSLLSRWGEAQASCFQICVPVISCTSIDCCAAFRHRRREEKGGVADGSTSDEAALERVVRGHVRGLLGAVCAQGWRATHTFVHRLKRASGIILSTRGAGRLRVSHVGEKVW